MKKIILIIVVLLSAMFIFKLADKKSSLPTSPQVNKRIWEIKSIDTMKYSRDLSAEKLNDPTFNNHIDAHIKIIKDTGATHVAIATPYDDRFNSVLRRWVSVARKYDLNIWFRGNFSGWEGWFGEGRNSITRDQHLSMTRSFIKNNADLFKDGDVFSPCPECENGGPGDPRFQTNVADYRKFLIAERNASLEEFKSIDKDITVLDSMNFDVAKLIMDKETAQAMGNIIVIDHYVESPERLARDIDELHKTTGAKVFLGEFGAPIPDIHGNLTEEEQAQWIEQALNLIRNKQHLIGLNYWVAIGGSTAIYNEELAPKPAAEILKKFFKLDSLN
ncbi:MAG: hypothetical protein NUV69_04950 [Candidatus Curtissbacteria bacterium]|nr:hypothetical protein [Candidatus Curtissbacteria bacterium]